MGPPAALQRAVKVRHADHPPLIVRSENPAHLSLILPVEVRRADRADQKARTLLINPLAWRRIRKKGPHRPHCPPTRIGRRIQ
jgi:hypothetical protein